MNIEASLNICSPYLVYSQIWPNLPMDDCHVGLHKEIPKEKHTVQPLNFEVSPNSQQQQQSIIRGH
jgi:hypothetical protein